MCNGAAHSEKKAGCGEWPSALEWNQPSAPVDARKAPNEDSRALSFSNKDSRPLSFRPTPFFPTPFFQPARVRCVSESWVGARSPQRGVAASPPFLIGPAPAHPDALTAREGAELPQPRATRRVEPPGSHEFCTVCARHGRGRVPTVLWGTPCARGGRITLRDLSSP